MTFNVQLLIFSLDARVANSVKLIRKQYKTLRTILNIGGRLSAQTSEKRETLDT